jgi:adenosylcobinamide-GDP ribazoletransferase
MNRPLQIALGFLTVFKTRLTPYPDMMEVGRSAWAFPVIGALVGIILVAVHAILSGHLPAALTAVLIVGIWVVLTGGLHLDGWTDCWDALGAAVSPERRFEIMKDSRLGTFGALGLLLLLAVKAAAVGDSALSRMALFLAPVIGRGTMVLASHGSQHRGDGMAAAFLSGLDDQTVKWAAILGLGPALLAGWSGILAALAAYAGAVWFRRFAESRLPSINGDVLGGMCEFSEAIFLAVSCATW